MAMGEVPNLERATLDFGDTPWVKFENYPIPSSFEVRFGFKDGSNYWGTNFSIRISEHGTPKLLQVTVLGSVDIYTDALVTDLLENENEFHGVDRWQLKVIEQYRFQLLEIAIAAAIHLQGPTPKDGEPWWVGIGGSLNAIELKMITAQIHKRIGQKITPEFLKGVADIYTKAGERNEKPIRAIAERFQCSHRTAQEYASKARGLNLLPPTTQGKVTVEKTIAGENEDDQTKIR